MLSDFVRHRRTTLGLSLTKLAMRAGTTKGHLHSIEKGESGNPTCSMVVALASGLQVSAVELFKIAAELSDISICTCQANRARHGKHENECPMTKPNP